MDSIIPFALRRMKKPKELDLLLIGKTGNGKSSTGNSILQRKAFLRSASSQSVTRKIQSEFSEYKGYIIKVVDSPGVCETPYLDQKAVKLASRALKQAMLMNPVGYHAFLIVVKFGSRFTGEEQEAIKFLKGFFGANFVRDFCIIVMTAGDNFATEFEESGKSFQSWYQEQSGEMGKLLAECENRMVLFDNNTKDQSIRENQINKLLNLVENLNGGKRYSDKNFEDARSTRTSVIVETRAPIISEETHKETSLILQKLDLIQSSKDEDSNKQSLEELKERCAKLLQDVQIKDKGTNVLIELVDSIKTIQTTIDDEIKFNVRMKKEREENREKEEDNKRKHEEQMQELNQKLQSLLVEKELQEKIIEDMNLKNEQREKERKAQEEEMKRLEMEERDRLRKEKDEAEQKYLEAKERSNDSLISRSVDWLAAPIRSTGNWLASFLSSPSS
ncbi:Immune-associated nucleotide-binding protein 9 [Bulinus truncatus]|nr:Immune-associated nucleotide-binding protein 9 [Bulinus truncatus]